MLFKGIIKVIQFMFVDKNRFWALLRANFHPCLAARSKINLSQTTGRNIIMQVNIKSIVLTA